MQLIPLATTTDVRNHHPSAVVLPVGSFEQHGDNLPLATDTLIACAIADRLARSYDLLLLPPVTMSCSHEHAGWPGTVSISLQTLSAIVTDIGDSLKRQGITGLVIVNGHGGNYVLSNVVQTANADTPRSMILFPTRGDWDTARRDAALATTGHEDMHAGELETSVLLATYPDAVRTGGPKQDYVVDDRRLLLSHGMTAYTDSGVIGRPSAATAQKGHAVLDSLTTSFRHHLQALAATRHQDQ